jgi:hypothetical protein
MGWLHEAADDHEGWLAWRLTDGRLSSSSSSEGVLVYDLRAGLEALVAWASVAGWTATCECGWLGSSWNRRDLTPNIAATEWRGLDGPDVMLPNGLNLDEAGRQEWLDHIEPLLVLSEIQAATMRMTAEGQQRDHLVAIARSLNASWASIGAAAGITRQAAQERWAPATPPAGPRT